MLFAAYIHIYGNNLLYSLIRLCDNLDIKSLFHNGISMVRKAGLEPARVLAQGILSPRCLPIPPFAHI